MMNFEPYIRITRLILSYEEFRLALQLFRGLLLVCCAFIVVLALLHTLYYLGQRTPMYQRKAPVDGWNRRFFGAAAMLLVVLLVISWATGLLLRTHS